MWQNPRETVEFVTFPEKILQEKLHFLCSKWRKREFKLFQRILLLLTLNKHLSYGLCLISMVQADSGFHGNLLVFVLSAQNISHIAISFSRSHFVKNKSQNYAKTSLRKASSGWVFIPLGPHLNMHSYYTSTIIWEWSNLFNHKTDHSLFYLGVNIWGVGSGAIPSFDSKNVYDKTISSTLAIFGSSSNSGSM